MPAVAIGGNILAQTEQNYYRSLGTKLYYEAAGRGEPLLLLHGNGESGRIFDEIAGELRGKYRLILPDTRGHGRSEKGGQPFDFTLFSQDVCALLDHLGLDSAHILGFSDGGSTAMQLALSSPHRVRSLILLGANMSPKGIKAACQVPIVLGWALCSLIARVNQKAVDNRDILELMVKHPNFTAEQLSQITAPTLILAGERDIVKGAETKQIAASIPDSRVEIIPGAGHNLPGERPKEVAGLVRDFLDGRR